MLYTVLAILKSSHMHHYNFNPADFLGMRDWLSSFAGAADFDSTDVPSMWNCFADRLYINLYKFPNLASAKAFYDP